MSSTALYFAYREAFLRLFFPEKCGVCEAFLELSERHLCRSCLGQVRSLKYDPSEGLSEQKDSCWDHAWAICRYEEPVKTLMAAVKFSKKRGLLKVFEHEMQGALQALTGDHPFDALVPIPVCKQTLLEREFNQAELIAKMASRITGTRLQTGWLKKNHPTPCQSHLRRDERLANLHGAYRVAAPNRATGKSFLLIDDIFTTGATAHEAARVLKAAGAARVDIFTLARTERTP